MQARRGARERAAEHGADLIWCGVGQCVDRVWGGHIAQLRGRAATLGRTVKSMTNEIKNAKARHGRAVARAAA